MRLRTAALLAVAVAAALAAWYLHGRSPATVDVTPSHPQPLRLGVGTFRGVRLGERTGSVRVIWIVTVSPSAELRHGVNIGDSMAIARRWFPRLACSGHDSAGPDGDESRPPICQGRLHPGMNLELIGDPIETIAIHGVRPSA